MTPNKITGVNCDESRAGSRAATLRLIADGRFQMANCFGGRSRKCGTAVAQFWH